MKNLKLLTLAFVLVVLTAISVNAASMSASPAAPAVDGEDIANYGGVTGTDKWWTDSKSSGYPKGQTFTTGNEAVWLNSLSYEIAENQSAEVTKNYTLRVGTVYGTVFTEIYRETATQNIQWIGAVKAALEGVNPYPFMTWSFDSPVLLAPNTEYGIDIGMTSSSSGWQSGIPYLNRTDNNYSGGTRYMSGTSGYGVGDDTMNNMSGDMVFHLDLELADGTPGYAYPQNGAKIPGGELELSWTNLDANVGSDVWVDVWFGTDPLTDFSKIVDKGINTTSYTIADISDGRYYWQVNSYINGSSSGSPVEGSLLTFYVDDTAEPNTISALTALKNHILGSPTLNSAEIEAHYATINENKTLFGRSYDVMAAAFDLVETYDSNPGDGNFGPLWIDSHPPSIDTLSGDLKSTLYIVMQAIMDNTYNSENIAQYEALLDGYKFGCSAVFPGSVNPPATITTHTATINASYPDTAGWERLGDTLPARKPTGTYVAPGSIVTVTVPPALVDSGYIIRVGAHSWDLSRRSNASTKRLERSSILYPIDNTEIRVANPLGGGIYIEVPYRADGGVVNIDITGAVRSPYYSYNTVTGHITTLEEWQTVERNHPGPWADFQTEKYMTQVPTSWISDLDDPVTGMADWDMAIDTFNDLMGFPRDRGKETIYAQLDVINRSSVFAPGYPSVNTSNSNPTAGNGNTSSYLVRGPNTNIWISEIEFHEQGHGFFFPKFGGERESNVNLPYVAVMNQAFGHDMDFSFAASLGFEGNQHRTLNNTAITWMTSFNFSPREVQMHSLEKQYQLKGHAKFVDIANMFGWQTLNNFWKSFVDDYEAGGYSTAQDDMILRLCKAVGVDVRPLLHFWGIHPTNNTALGAAIAAEGLRPSFKIHNRLLEYKSLVPADNAAFQTFGKNWWNKVEPNINGYWTETEHARQWDTRMRRDKDIADQQRPDLTVGEMYVEAVAADIQDRVQDIIDLYFPEGSPVYSVELNDMVSWSGEPIVLDPNVVNDGGGSLTYSWTADPVDGVVFSATDIEAPTVTITKPAGDAVSYTLALAVSDGVNLPAADTMIVDVYDDACQATRLGLGIIDSTDLNGDCITNLKDFIIMSESWLEISGLETPQHKID